MNGIAILGIIFAATSQVTAGSMPVGIKDGWKLEGNQSLSYIVQLTPELATQIGTQGQELEVAVPEPLQGSVQRIIVRIGRGEVEREPSLAELQSMPRNVLPRGASPTGLTNLTGNNGFTVPIDRQRSDASPVLPAGSSRLSDESASLTVPPSLAQYSAPSSRSPFGSQIPEMPRMASTGATSGGLSSSSSAPILPTNPNASAGIFPPTGMVGPPVPPNYTYGGVSSAPVTVTGTNTGSVPSLSTNPYNAPNTGWSNPGSSTGSSPIGTTFGNAQNYLPANQTQSGGYNMATPMNQALPQNSSTTMVANPNLYTSAPPSTYPGSPNPFQAVPTGYPNANSPLAAPATGPSYYPSNTSPTYATAAPTAVLAQQPSYPPPMTPPPAYTHTATVPPNYATNLPPSTVPASSTIQTVGTRNPLDDRRLQDRYLESESSSPNYVLAFLFLVSLVGNVYLVALLNQLLQRYRVLQANHRGSTSLAV